MHDRAATSAPAAQPVSEVGARRSVLLAVTGLSPQVVTETLYAVHRESPARLPTEVHLITTATGAERARLALLSDQPGWFRRFLRDFRTVPIAFSEAHIHVLSHEDGTPMIDLTTARDNAVAADQIAALVRTFSGEDVWHLHVSIAGGRKTLGFLAGYALSLWGRREDRLSHVLVNDTFEQSWDFFYPTPYEHIIETRNGTLADCAGALVSLADIPFVRLRHVLPASMLEHQAGFAAAVQAAQTALGPRHLLIDLQGRRVVAGNHAFCLPPADLAYFAWFARRAKAKQSALPCPSDGVPSSEYAREYLLEYHRIVGPMGETDRTVQRYRQGMAKSDFEERKSKLKRELIKALGDSAADYMVQGEGRRPMRYRLRLDPESIEFAASMPVSASLGMVNSADRT